MSAAERILDALFVVTASDKPMSANEIAAALDVPLSTAYRHIAVLKHYDLVVDLGREAGFAPGIGCWRIGRGFDDNRFLATLAEPEMRALAARTQESVGLMRAAAGDVYCAEMIESPLSLRCSFVKGSAQPLRAGASAKSLLAFMSQARRSAALKNGPTGAALQKLEADLAAIRSQGYAESESEVDFGVWGVSAPVFSAPGQMECSLTVMVPVIRVGDRREEFIAATVASAENITKLLASSEYSQKGNG
ncbi:IclR family transcriptional regulator [Breoghania corrubedonensis]|uniref:IclR family transcriptional regulator n=1 Tax=Breoghania corrubedonensis TaxID=665038 RepID=A0A2T5V6E2_9HYPH|nr:IclR family transcriptional regulator [Breoghania corrubedonensis]PTW59319.1 IclR family transcriptional regulator [Breoghania corrubedonensis]